MMQKIRLGLIVAALLATPSLARADAGVYIGLQVGGHQITNDNTAPNIEGVSDLAFNGALLTGFEFEFAKGFFLAIEGYGGLHDYKFEELRSEYFVGGNAMLGWRPFPGFRMHAFGGPQWIYLRQDGGATVDGVGNAAEDLATAQFQDFTLGFRVGGGVAVNILGPNWRARLDYAYTRTEKDLPLADVTTDSLASIVQGTALTSHIVTLGLIRVF